MVVYSKVAFVINSVFPVVMETVLLTGPIAVVNEKFVLLIGVSTFPVAIAVTLSLDTESLLARSPVGDITFNVTGDFIPSTNINPW